MTASVTVADVGRVGDCKVKDSRLFDGEEMINAGGIGQREVGNGTPFGWGRRIGVDLDGEVAPR
jgi:hypothetical protein